MTEKKTRQGSGRADIMFFDAVFSAQADIKGEVWGLSWETVRHGREVVDELGLSRSKQVSSPATVDGVTRRQGDELEAAR